MHKKDLQFRLNQKFGGTNLTSKLASNLVNKGFIKYSNDNIKPLTHKQTGFFSMMMNENPEAEVSKLNMRYGGNVQENLNVSNGTDNAPEPGPRDQRPQLGIDTYLRDVVIPKYGGTLNLWKQYLNEISFHESGDKQRWDINTRQLTEPSANDKNRIQKFFINIFGSEDAKNENRLVPGGVGKGFGQLDNRHDASAFTALRAFTGYAGIDPLLAEYYNEENSPHIFPQDETYSEKPPFTGQLNMLPGLPNQAYKNLTDLYLRHVKYQDGKFNRYKVPFRNAKGEIIPKPEGKDWSFYGQIDARNLSPEEQGILMLTIMMQNHDKNEKSRKGSNLDNLMVSKKDENGKIVWSLADVKTRGDVWFNMYNRADNSHYRKHTRNYRNDAKDFVKNYKNKPYFAEYSWDEMDNPDIWGNVKHLNYDQGKWNYPPFVYTDDYHWDIFGELLDTVDLKYQDWYQREENRKRGVLKIDPLSMPMDNLYIPQPRFDYPKYREMEFFNNDLKEIHWDGKYITPDLSLPNLELQQGSQKNTENKYNQRIEKKEYGGANKDGDFDWNPIRRQRAYVDSIQGEREAELANIPHETAGSALREQEINAKYDEILRTKGVPNFLAKKWKKFAKGYPTVKKAWDLFWSKEAWGLSAAWKAPVIYNAIKGAKTNTETQQEIEKGGFKPYEPKY